MVIDRDTLGRQYYDRLGQELIALGRATGRPQAGGAHDLQLPPE